MKRYFIFLLLASGLLFLLFPIQGACLERDKWVNPKDLVKDPNLVRLQMGKKELTNVEKEELAKYGYTGLEVMTYVDMVKYQLWANCDEIHSCVNASRWGGIKVGDIWGRRKFYIKSYLDRLNHNGIKPGEIEYKELYTIVSPPERKGSAILGFFYLNSDRVYKEKAEWRYSVALRKVSRLNPYHRQDNYGSMITTRDDDESRDPWEENHRIIGEDSVRGYDCLVIESIHKDPKYYLSKRVVWVERNKFLEIHEEQFDRKGRLYKIFDKYWYQVEPGGFWAPRQTNIIELPRKRRTIHRTVWEFQRHRDSEFTLGALATPAVGGEEKFVHFPPIRGYSDLPPEPTIRWEFWKKRGIAIKVKE
jgi:hypothetical protein